MIKLSPEPMQWTGHDVINGKRELRIENWQHEENGDYVICFYAPLNNCRTNADTEQQTTRETAV